MKKIIILLSLFSSLHHFAQIKGTITDLKGKPIPFVNIYIKDTYISTVSNDLGKFELNPKTPGKQIVLFQYLGYKTEKRTVEYNNSPQILDVKLIEEEIQLNEVVIDAKNNPAIEIIQKTIANRKENAKKTARYRADFYSRGIFRVKNLPKTILGQKIDFFDEIIDSTRSGILYLSETVSKITFQKPDKLKEVITASKVSGNDNGFSFNSAAQANYDFYENYLPFQINVVSPIADNAFNYYKYKFEGSFYDENNQQINKIKVSAKRENEPVMEGFIYIVDESWAIYAVDLSIKGKQMQTPEINVLTLKQNFTFNTNSKIWVKNTQTIDFLAGMLGVNISGRFTYVYSNFEFETQFDKKTFTSEVLRFEENANKKEDTFWNTIRPVPLTDEEQTDYLKKEVLQTKKKSKTYLDSIDNKRNKFRFMDILNGYSYTNSYKKWSINYEGPLLSTTFNTVQGWNFKTGLSYTKRNEEKRTYVNIGGRLTYGLDEDKFRAVFSYVQKFNNKDYSTLEINGGSTVSQFNANNPISNVVNMVSSVAFKNNFMKLYEKNFISTRFGREFFNGLYMRFGAEYAERKPLYNNSDYSLVKSDKIYTSNNPLLPYDFLTPGISKHNLIKGTILARIRFGQQYWTRPDGKYNIGNDDFPTLYLGYEKSFLANDKSYEYDLISARTTYDLPLGNKGVIKINSGAGKFFNAATISFVDYKHFSGNQTHIGQSESYTSVFNLLPYYSSSTNKSYWETHIEHSDKGYFMNKIPLLNKLQSQLVLGFHNLSIADKKPYQEFSVGLDNLGFGKFRMFRVDYVRSYQNGYQGDGVIFGLKFLNILE